MIIIEIGSREEEGMAMAVWRREEGERDDIRGGSSSRINLVVGGASSSRIERRQSNEQN